LRKRVLTVKRESGASAEQRSNSAKLAPAETVLSQISLLRGAEVHVQLPPHNAISFAGIKLRGLEMIPGPKKTVSMTMLAVGNAVVPSFAAIY
jgi:hypothetical protein